MKKVAFTICAKNYLGLALLLEKSINDHNEDIEFYVFIADEFSKTDNIDVLPKNVIIARDTIGIESSKWNQMAFKYDLTEFCTSIKPTCFKYIFEKYNPDSCIYFDPDILVYNSLNTIYDILILKSIIVTPHIVTIQDKYSGKLDERKLFYSGMFNLGFLGLKNDIYSQKMLNWWEIRLEDRCFQDMMENYFTDQKWIDFLPSFFPNQILISQNLGLNVAPWNFYEREIEIKGETFYVKNRLLQNQDYYPLIFLHFSGFNYKSLLDEKINQINIPDLEIYNDLLNPIATYTKYLKESNLNKYIKLNYSYNYFTNGVTISSIYRKLFRRLYEDSKIDTNPFDSNEEFYKKLKYGNIINKTLISSDKTTASNYYNIEKKLIFINKIFYFIFKIIGVNKFFLLTRMMRIYSKKENHVYLIDKSYFKNFKIRN